MFQHVCAFFYQLFHDSRKKLLQSAPNTLSSSNMIVLRHVGTVLLEVSICFESFFQWFHLAIFVFVF